MSNDESNARGGEEIRSRLSALAHDLHWAWNHAGDDVWKRLNETVWERLQNPMVSVRNVTRRRLDDLASDAEFLHDLGELEASRARYRVAPAWRPAGSEKLPLVAYFSMEFGLHDALPLYAGGLGILAGDVLKTASDLGVPVVGVGILWQQGYFRQVLDAAGNQNELYPYNEPASLPLEPVLSPAGERMRIHLTFPGRTIYLRAWRVTVGRSALYLLDSNDPLNEPSDRGLTGSLYGGSSETRLLQEIILGVGGWRLVQALGLEVEICHLNEGHAAFVVVERARAFMEAHGLSFHESLWATRPGNVFTTHTAVPAGFDTFTSEEIEKHRVYIEEYARSLDIPSTELLALGREHPDDAREPFNMAWLAMRGCGWANAVSRLHGAVSRKLFLPLFPHRPEREVPVVHVTNGVHVPSWDSPWTDALWTRAAGKERWRGDVSALEERIAQLSDEDLWRVRGDERADLVRYARRRLAGMLLRRGRIEDAERRAEQVLDPSVLTLGFARRFATYKRPDLILSDRSRLLRMLTDEGRPVQLIVAGKAHPRDEEGKRLIREWTEFCARPEARNRVVFLDDYDMRLAKELVQGVDVWLNTPRRPWEASGTSGMKVLVNGGLNLSTLDGWWEEAFDPALGWTLDVPDAQADSREAEELYRILEEEVVPEFYDRDAEGYPRRWLARMRASMSALTPRFSSVRMLQEYVERAYVPGSAALWRRASSDDGVARDLAGWARRLRERWGGIRFGEVSASSAGGRLTVSVPVDLGEIQPEWVRVELYAETPGGDPLVFPMEAGAPVSRHRNAREYRAVVETIRPYGDFTPRVVPYHPEARVPMELPLVAWQR